MTSSVNGTGEYQSAHGVRYIVTALDELGFSYQIEKPLTFGWMRFERGTNLGLRRLTNATQMDQGESK